MSVAGLFAVLQLPRFPCAIVSARRGKSERAIRIPRRRAVLARLAEQEPQFLQALRESVFARHGASCRSCAVSSVNCCRRVVGQGQRQAQARPGRRVSHVPQSRPANRKHAQPVLPKLRPSTTSDLTTHDDDSADAPIQPIAAQLPPYISTVDRDNGRGIYTSTCRSARAPASSTASARCSASRCCADGSAPRRRRSSLAWSSTGIARLGPRRCISGMSTPMHITTAPVAARAPLPSENRLHHSCNRNHN